MITFILVVISAGLAFVLKKKLQQAKWQLEEIISLRAELSKFSPLRDLEVEIKNRRDDLDQTKKLFKEVSDTLKEYEFRQDLEESFFYRPHFDFEDIAQYSEALQLVRNAQKELIKQKLAFHNPAGQEVTETSKKGIGKLGLGAFNADADEVVQSVKYNNLEESKEKLRVAFNKINNLIGPTGLQLSSVYLDLKIKEMILAHEYREAEQKAKDEQAELKEQMREEEDARIEAEEAREEAIKEQERYQLALDAARNEMESKSESERAAFESKLRTLQAKLTEATEERERATSMAQITKKGHVYIISNIGSFGENVFKIGLTRRKDPLERVKELGDASVPFGFDVHAVISAEDAPELEHTLHQHFDHKRMNKVNVRKEFFRVTMDEIAHACNEKGLKVQLTRLAEAREFHETRSIEQEKKAA